MDIVLDSIPQRQILSYRARGPEAEAIFDLLRQQGPTKTESLNQAFAGTEPPGQPRKTEMLQDALDFLRAVELVGRWHDEAGVCIYGLLENVDTDVSFRILLLQQLHHVADNRDAFRKVHDVAIEDDMFFATKADLLRKLESLYPGDYAWNTEKLRALEWLGHYLGLLRPLDSRQSDFMICPTPILLLSTLRLCAEKGLGEDLHGEGEVWILLHTWLGYINQHLFGCFTGRREVHQGLARAILSMDSQKQIRLEMMSDAPGSLMLCDRRASHIRFRLSDAV